MRSIVARIAFSSAGLVLSLAIGCSSEPVEPDRCDCEPVIAFTSPTGGTLTEFNDADGTEIGIQYAVKVTTRCVPDGARLSLTNSLSAGEEVQGQVVIDNVNTGDGHVDFGIQTFLEGTNRLCVHNASQTDRMADGSTDCEPYSEVFAPVCKDVHVQLGVPACRFDSPLDGSSLTGDDDSSAEAGFQHDAQVVCKGVNDGQPVALSVNGRPAINMTLSNAAAVFEDVELAVGFNLLRAQTTGHGGGEVTAEITVSVETGECVLRVLPPDGTVIGASLDADSQTDGLQVAFEVETDEAGSFACADGSSVDLHVGPQVLSGALLNGRVAFQATLEDGEVLVYATAEEPGGRPGRSLTNHYAVCATEVALSIESPRDGLTVTDAADRDPNTTGIQVAVTGTSNGLASAEQLWIEVNGQIVKPGGEMLRPSEFQVNGTYVFKYVTFLNSRDYTIQVKARDACGEEYQSPLHTLTINTTQLTCALAAPLDGQVLLVADDKNGLPDDGLQFDVQVETWNVPEGHTFSLYITGQETLTGLSIVDGGWTGEVTFTTPSEFAHTKQIQCVLQSGEASPMVTVTVDNHAPSVEIATPADGTLLDATDYVVEVLTTGVENGQLLSVIVSDGTGQEEFTGTVNGNGAAVAVELFEGLNTLTARVADAAGNQAESAAVQAQVILFTEPPVLTFADPDETQPQPIAIPSAGAYSVQLGVQNVLDRESVSLVVRTNGIPGQARHPDSFDGETALFQSTLANGDVVLEASAVNPLGVTQKSVTLFVGPITAPAITLTNPTDGTYTSEAHVQASAQTIRVDPGGVCHFCIRETIAGLVPACTQESQVMAGIVDGGGVCTAGFDLPREADWQVWASVANQSESATSLPVQVVLDTTAPQVAFVLPADGNVYNAVSPDTSPASPGFQVRVQISADVEDGQTANLTGQAGIVGEAPVFADGLIVFPAVTLAEGVTTLEAEVCDRAGNCGQATPVTITVDRTVPDVVITAPEDLAQLGASDDESLEDGFQLDVAVQFVDAAVGDEAALYLDGSATPVVTRQLTADDLDGFTFQNVTVTLLPSALVQIAARLTDAAANAGSDQVTVTINTFKPEVAVTRPEPGEHLNIFADLEPGIADLQTQVDISTNHTSVGDKLVLCVCQGTCTPDLAADPDTEGCEYNGFGATAWTGHVTGATTPVFPTIGQGAITLRAYAENIPGQGTYSSAIVIQVDSQPPTVTSLVIQGDEAPVGCLSASETTWQIVANLDDGANSLNGLQARLYKNWPTGTLLRTATIDGNTVSFDMPQGTLGEGVNDLTVQFLDAFDNPNIRAANPIVLDEEAMFSLEVDVTPPLLAIAYPANGTLNSADDLDADDGQDDCDFTFEVTTTAEDGQVVTFGPMGGSAEVSSGVASITASLGQGDATLEANVSDACGNPATPATRVVHVDTLPPVIVACGQPTSQTYDTQDVPISCQVSGTPHGGQFTVHSDQGDNCSHVFDGEGQIEFTCSLGEAIHSLTIRVTDDAGNVSEPVVIPDVRVDVDGCPIQFSNPPSVLNASDDSDSPSNDIAVDLRVCSNDPHCTSTECPVCTISLSADGVSKGTAGFDENGCADFIGVVLPHKDNAYTDLVAQANDGSNLTTTSVDVLVDLHPPVIGLNSPGGTDVDCVAAGNPRINGTTVLADKNATAPDDCDIDFLFTVTDGGQPGDFMGTFTLQIDASPIDQADVDESPESLTYTNRSLAHDATHTITAEAVDAAGNQASVSVTVVVDVVAPGQVGISDSVLTDNRRANLDLIWSGVGDDGASGGDVAAYRVRWARAAIDTQPRWLAAEEKYFGASTTASLSGLPPLNTYHLAVRAEDELGNISPLPVDHVIDNFWNQVISDRHDATFPGYGFFAWNLGNIDHDPHGRDDLAVAAPWLNGADGALYILYGTDDLTDWSDSASRQELLRGANEMFGWDLSVGNLNDDANGYPDVAIGSYNYNGGQGRVSVYAGQNGALPVSPAFEIRGAAGQANEFGRAVEVLGDVNGDGIADLFVAAPKANVYGRGYLFYGRSASDWQDLTVNDNDGTGPYVPVTAADVIFQGVDVQAGKDEWFGYRHGATGLGDLDGDGYDDFVLVASAVNQVYVFDGYTVSQEIGSSRNVNPLTDSVAVLSYGAAYDDGTFRAGFGTRTVGGIDLVADGHADLLVADAFHHKTYVFAGLDAGGEDPPVQIETAPMAQIDFAENINFGFDVDAGDINGDGLPDLLLGSNSSAAGKRAFVFLNRGSGEYFLDLADSQLTVPEAITFGVSVALGDFDGNGALDVVVGDDYQDRIYVYY